MSPFLPGGTTVLPLIPDSSFGLRCWVRPWLRTSGSGLFLMLYISLPQSVLAELLPSRGVASIPWRCFHYCFAVPSDSPIMGVCTCVCTLHGWEYGTESQACPAVAF